MADPERQADDALRALFATLPEPADDGFSELVMGRIGRRTRRRRVMIAAAVVAGALIAAWPLGQLMLQLSDGLRQLAISDEVTGWATEHRTLLAGIALASLTPLLAALLED